MDWSTLLSVFLGGALATSSAFLLEWHRARREDKNAKQAAVDAVRERTHKDVADLLAASAKRRALIKNMNDFVRVDGLHAEFARARDPNSPFLKNFTDTSAALADIEAAAFRVRMSPIRGLDEFAKNLQDQHQMINSGHFTRLLIATQPLRSVELRLIEAASTQIALWNGKNAQYPISNTEIEDSSLRHD